ncbi:MAG TPA: hypothetical protein VF880_16285, partial [Actinomycetes bacterium]
AVRAAAVAARGPRNRARAVRTELWRRWRPGGGGCAASWRWRGRGAVVGPGGPAAIDGGQLGQPVAFEAVQVLVGQFIDRGGQRGQPIRPPS